MDETTGGDETTTGWRERMRRRRALAVLQHQLANQARKAEAVRGREERWLAYLDRKAAHVREMLARVRPLDDGADRILEVGSGPHGIVFGLGARHAVGLDPLAAPYRRLFPVWQPRAPAVAAAGEALPFGAAAFDVVLCDNVIDHAERPAAVLDELVRVLKPGGLLYFTVNVHHPFYAAASALHAGWRAVGVPWEIRPFATHTTHLTPARARKMLARLPLRRVYEQDNVQAAREQARRSPPRHAGDRLKRVFFKNATYEVVAVRE